MLRPRTPPLDPVAAAFLCQELIEVLIDYGILQTDSIPIRITSTVLISPTIGFPVLY
jgi:hypothetical protein